MKPELHLPDLPEVEVALGADAPAEPSWRAQTPWPARLRMAISSYLPILLMTLLALATWWLVQNSPQRPEARTQAAPRHEPDYRMDRFVAQRYDKDGRLVLRIEGDRLFHYPDTDEVEIETVHLRAWSAEGRETIATAQRAIAAGDSSQVRLLGRAVVTSDVGRDEPMIVRGELLQVFPKLRRVQSDQPVVVVQGASQLRADGGIRYDDATQIALLHGKITSLFEPALVRSPAASGAR